MMVLSSRKITGTLVTVYYSFSFLSFSLTLSLFRSLSLFIVLSFVSIILLPTLPRSLYVRKSSVDVVSISSTPHSMRLAKAMRVVWFVYADRHLVTFTSGV
eukprot:COSAG01_NODE_271_length_19794_cov_73.630890_12_plen_101_part_00